MREILFRGQTRKRGELVHIVTHEPLDGKWQYGGVLQGTCAHSIIYGYDNDDQIGTIQKHVVYTDTLGQYTGLKDKNGKKIFEGDIIKIPDDYDEFGINAGEKYEVIFGFGGFRLKPKYGRNAKGYWLEDDGIVEVIGNIHDNPELIGGVSDENA